MVFDFIEDTRQLARSLLALDFSNTEIQKEVDAARSKIYGLTQKNDWDNDDIQKQYIDKLIVKQAAIWVLEHYDTSAFDPVLAAWTNEINTGIKEIADGITDATLDDDVIVVASEYQSYPLALSDNDQSQPYRSTSIHI